MKEVDWVTKLMDFIQEVKYKPFEWGKWDCCIFADEALYRISGNRVIPDEIKGWETEEEAQKTIKAYGKTLCNSLNKAAKKEGMKEIDLPYLSTGDLVLMKTEEGGEIAGICDGNWLFAPTDDGLTNKRLDMALRAWRI